MKKEIKNVSREEIISLIEAKRKGGQFFTIEFIKKDGTNRKMTCRFGVTSHLAGGKTTIDVNKFFIVWDCSVKDYRAVNKETVHTFSTRNTVFKVE